MPKAPKSKFYAVRVGREGPKVYTTWDEVSRYPAAIHRSFLTLKDAQEWIDSFVAVGNNARDRSPSLEIIESRTTQSTYGKRPPDMANEVIEIDSDSDVEGANPERPSPPSRPPLPPPPKPNEIVLSPEQSTVLRMVKEGRNVFFTGSAGTGKSVLLREIINYKGGAGTDLGITASTGIAAVNIGGTTIHSWAGIGLGQEPVQKLVGKLFGQEKLRDVRQRWQQVQTLIIDEISMLDGTLFDKLEEIARALRNDKRPFGGIQLVLSGDFFQLPPVPNQGKDATFAFNAKSWDGCIGAPITLTRVFRQKNQAFVDILNAMRFGKLDTKTIKTFQSLSRVVQYTDGIEPTELFSTRREVDSANQLRLDKLPGSMRKYVASDRPGTDSTSGAQISLQKMSGLLERLIAPKELQLKVGAQVMLIKNITQGQLVNGSMGQVLRFGTANDVVKEQLAVSRVAGAEGPGGGGKPLPSGEWPIVRFILTGNGGTRDMLCIPQDFTIENASGGVEATRTQVPLICSWAMSVHKSQGQTLQRVKVDMTRTFEKGQAYVALSRATCMEQLQVVNFSAAKVAAHPDVLAWYHKVNSSSNVLADDELDEYMNDHDGDEYYSF